jgi:serine/threonine protein kinase
MSPEQALGQETDYRSDQFSFALVLYEMASGKQAFAKPNSVETMAAIIQTSIPFRTLVEAGSRLRLGAHSSKQSLSSFQSPLISCAGM